MVPRAPLTGEVKLYPPIPGSTGKPHRSVCLTQRIREPVQ